MNDLIKSIENWIVKGIRTWLLTAELAWSAEPCAIDRNPLPEL